MSEYISREELDNILSQYVSREERDSELMQVYSEIAHDRKRITMIEEFTRELFSILWVRFRSIRKELDDKVRGKFSSILTLNDEM